jgi:hypothetical protein
MTKTTTKAKTGTKESTPAAPLIVLGYDENYKPRAARFPAADVALVTKAAHLMDLKVYEAATEDLAALAKKLPVGRLYGNGRGFVPNIRQSLYSDIIATLVGEPEVDAIGKNQDEPAVATGLPRTWDEIAPGISSSPRKLWNTAGGKPSSSVATATCSRCGFGTTRSCPNLFATATLSR